MEHEDDSDTNPISALRTIRKELVKGLEDLKITGQEETTVKLPKQFYFKQFNLA